MCKRFLTLFFVFCLGLSSAAALPYPQRLISLLQSMALGKRHGNYRLEALREVDRSYTSFSLLPQLVYKNAQEEGRVYLLTNESCETLSLNGRSLLRAGDFALALTKTTLLPHEQGLLLVVSKGIPPSDLTKHALLTSKSHLVSGTFVKAILLGGVDAFTTGAASSESRPVLLRIIGSGTLPHQREVDLKGCHVLTSTYGDLSSERVYMRLEKLTCADNTTGKVKEAHVEGYVVGEDGKTGVRGIVVDKAGPFLRNSLWSGFFIFLSKLLENPQTLLVLPTTTLPHYASRLCQTFSSGASRGTNHILEKYARFFMKRAEQLQPILQISAGREVDIVFTKGVKFKKKSKFSGGKTS